MTEDAPPWATPRPARRNARPTHRAIFAVARTGVLSTAALIAASTSAVADWTLSSSGTAGAIATDNVDLTPSGQQHSAIEPFIGGSFNLRGSGQYGNLAGDYQGLLLEQIGAGEPQTQPLSAGLVTGTGVLAKDWLFVDGYGSAERAVTASNAAVSQNPGAATSQQTSIETVGVSPYLRHSFDFGDAELRYRYQHLFLGGATGDADRNQESGLFSREFAPNIKGSLEGENDALTADNPGGLGSLYSTFGRAGLEEAIIRQFSLTQTAGWERNEIKTDSTIQRPLWNVGFIARPGPRTEIEAAWGQRYGRDNLYAQANYQISTSAVAGARHVETLESYSEDLLNRDIALGVDQQGNIIDTRTGVPASFGQALPGVPTAVYSRRGVDNPGVFIIRSNDAYLDFPGANTNVLVGGYYDQLSPLTPTSLGEVNYGARTRWVRTLAPATSLFLDGLYDRSRSSGAEGANTLAEQIGVAHGLPQSLTGTIAYSRADRFTGPSNERYRENAILLSLSRPF